MLILASKSPRRKQLLELAEIPFEIITADTDESYPEDLDVQEVPVFIASKKALAIAELHPHRKILACDTVVVLDGQIIGKPIDREDAVQILSRLSGQCHWVITGVVILDGPTEKKFWDVTKVTFNTLDPAEIEYYVNKYKPYDKAGAYAIQEWIGAIAIKHIEGCFYNVMGLPISKVVHTLREIGITPMT